MSEHEFDAYLALLGGMLGLSDEQREAISGELRDHMLERMHEQMAAGVPRDEAIQRALAEFGDASRLAAGLAAAATLHRRRLIMRWTFGTVVTFGLLLFVALAYWPAGENGPGPQMSVGKQQDGELAIDPDEITPGYENGNAVVFGDDPNERSFLALQQPITADKTMTVERLVSEIAGKVGVPVEYDLPPEGSETARQQLQKEIRVKLDRTPAFAVLQKAAQERLGFVLRYGTLTVVPPDIAEQRLFMQIYHVADLLAIQQEEPASVRGPAYGDLRRLVEERRNLLLSAKADEARSYEAGIVAAAELVVRDAEARQHGLPKLVRIIPKLIEPLSWEINGGPNSIEVYGDSLLVHATLPVHWEITQTLARLRKHALRDEATARRSPEQSSQLGLPISSDGAEVTSGPESVASRMDNSIPPYVIEPPDVLLISALKIVPKSPYKLNPLDVVTVKVVEGLDEQIAEAYAIQPDGTIDLGPSFGDVNIVDRTLQEATKAVENHLKRFINTPKVELSLAAASEVEQIRGQYLVGPDGRVNLGSYGQVYVAGKTIVEATAAIEEKLAEKLEDPEVVVDVFAYNSKVYYVITQGAGRGDNVVRVPITGNETVLDAISNLGGIRRASSKTIWIARPAPNGIGHSQELPVDWNAITHDGVTATNYQVLPGDRIFIADKNPEAQDEPQPSPRDPFDATRY